MEKRAIIVSGGTLEEDIVKREITTNDFVIGVDKGIEFLHQYQLPINYLVGDFDSVKPELIQKYKEDNRIPIREFNPVKDASDTEIAIRLAIELGYKELVILGATGSRLDHMWANIQVLTIPYLLGIKAVIIDGVNRIRILEQNEVLKKEEAYGTYFSVFSLGGKVEGLTIEGAKYPLSNHELLPYDSLSVSNQFQEETVYIQYESGYLILMESKEN